MKVTSKIKCLFKTPHPRRPFIYAVTVGKFLGELLVFTEKDSDSYNFLTLPNMDIRSIPIDKFDAGLENGIIDVVEKLPAYVHKTCLKQYSRNKTKTLAMNVKKD
jgi:hypothetical protein